MNNGAPMNCPKCGESMGYSYDRDIDGMIMKCIKSNCKGRWRMVMENLDDQ